MLEFHVRAAVDLASDELHAAFAEAFGDYLAGPFSLPVAQWPQFLRRQSVDMVQSRAAMQGDAVLAIALVAPRPMLRSWRLAMMGALPQARGAGAAPALLDDFVERAAAAGMTHVELECFAQNERALRLYRSRGFEVLHPLRGYTRAADATQRAAMARSGDDAFDVSIESAFDWLDAAARDLGDLPMQVTSPCLRAHPGTSPLSARRMGAAQVVYALPGDDVLTIQSLVDRGAGQAQAGSLVAGLMHDYPSRRIAVPQLQRPDLGGDALERLGFEQLPLHQFFMRRRL